MLLRTLCWTAVLLAVTPTLLIAQTMPATLSVETLKSSTSPTSVRTGEPFVQEYKITFLDLSKQGKHIEIFEDDVRPKSLPSPLGNFEIMNWEMDKSDAYTVIGEDTVEYNWYLRLQLRIIDPKKGDYIIPKIKFRWAMLGIGQDIKNVEAQEFETDEVHINYVTTVVQDPQLDIRDGIKLENDSRRTLLFWLISKVLSPILVLTPLALAIFFWRLRKKNMAEKPELKITKSEGEALVVEIKQTSFRKAYRQFFEQIRRFKRAYQQKLEDEQSLLTIERKLSLAVRDILTAKLEKIKPGDTINDIGEYIKINFKPGRKKENLMALQQFVADCQSDMESNYPCHLAYFPNANVDRLAKTVRMLKWYWRVVYIWTS